MKHTNTLNKHQPSSGSKIENQSNSMTKGNSQWNQVKQPKKEVKYPKKYQVVVDDESDNK